MAKGRTAWERLIGANKPVTVEKQYTNPLDVRIGATVRVDTIEHHKPIWTVAAIWAWDRQTGGSKTAGMTDYLLTATGGKQLLLRVLPREQANAKNTRTHHFLALETYHEQGWDDTAPLVLDALCDPTGEFYKDRGEETEECYWRINDVKVPYHCSVSVISDVNRDGTVEEEEVQKGEYTLWDFWRTTQDEADQDTTQFLYAQLSGRYDPASKRVHGGDKTIHLYRGFDVDPDKIVAYDKV